MTEKFYKLHHTFDRFEECSKGVNTDGYLEKFKGYDNLKSAFWDCAKTTIRGEIGIAEPEVDEDGSWTFFTAQVPEKIIFEVAMELLSETDYPHLKHADSWPIMSRRMVDVLLSVGEFPHQVIPVTCMESWNESDIQINNDYVILNLNQVSDVLDRDESVYSMVQSKIDPSKTFLSGVEKTILKEPVGGFPPIFRVKGNQTYLFVSAAAKVALEAAGMKGVRISKFWESWQFDSDQPNYTSAE